MPLWNETFRWIDFSVNTAAAGSFEFDDGLAKRTLPFFQIACDRELHFHRTILVSVIRNIQGRGEDPGKANQAAFGNIDA